MPDWCNPGPPPSGYELPGSFPWCLTGRESAVFGSDSDPDQVMQVTDHFYGKLDPAFSRH